MRKTQTVSIRGTSMPRNKCFHHIMMTPCFEIDFAPYEVRKKARRTHTQRKNIKHIFTACILRRSEGNVNTY